MGIFNSENATYRLQTGFWDKLRQEVMSFEQIVEFVPENFEIDENDTVTCLHCGDKFDVSKKLASAVNHLQNNHAGYIIEHEIQKVNGVS